MDIKVVKKGRSLCVPGGKTRRGHPLRYHKCLRCTSNTLRRRSEEGMKEKVE